MRNVSDNGNQSQAKSQKNTCFADRHLKPGPFKLYNLAYKLSHARENPSGIFWSNERKYADRLGVDKETIRFWMRYLEKYGWIVPQDEKGKRNPSGQLAPVRYKVLSHDEWSAVHSGQCLDACIIPKVEQRPTAKKRTKTRASKPVQVTPKVTTSTSTGFTVFTSTGFTENQHGLPVQRSTELQDKALPMQTEPFIAKREHTPFAPFPQTDQTQNQTQTLADKCRVPITPRQRFTDLALAIGSLETALADPACFDPASLKRTLKILKAERDALQSQTGREA